MRTVVVLICALLLTACARSSTIPLAADTVQITASAAPACGLAGAQSVAAKQAAVETIRRGFDKFVIVAGQYQNDVRVVGHTPMTAHTTGHGTVTGYGGFASVNTASTTTYSGGQPIVGGTHNQGLVVKMFRDGDPAGANAVPARDTLGPNWKEIASQPTLTCL